MLSKNTEKSVEKRPRKRRRSDKAVASPSSSKSGKADTTKQLRCSDRKKRVFKEYLEDQNLWVKDTLENVDRVREKQDCCQRELDKTNPRLSWTGGEGSTIHDFDEAS
jgi:hypothetical protein